jgi:predicted O-methyltransferase YrrM
MLVPADICERPDADFRRLQMSQQQLADEPAIEINGENAAFCDAVRKALGRIFGSVGGPYNIDTVAYLVAAIEGYQYAQVHMRNRPRFGSREELLKFSIQQASVTGLVLEFGVFSGYTINWIAEHFPNQTIFGFDSFQGLPEDWTVGAKKGHFATTGLPNVRGNVELIVGWFDCSLRPFLDTHPGSLSLLHVDCDLYSSTKTVLNELSDRIVPGTIIVFDEYYNYPDWKRHEYLAFNEFTTARSLKYEYIGLVPHFEQVAVRILG